MGELQAERESLHAEITQPIGSFEEATDQAHLLSVGISIQSTPQRLRGAPTAGH